MSKTLLGSIQIFFASLLFASYGIWAKLLPHDFPLWQETALRSFASFLIVLLIVIFGRHEIKKITKTDRKRFLLFAIPGAFVSYCYSLSFKYLTIGMGNLLFFGSIVISNALISKLIFKDIFNTKDRLGVILVLLGLIISAGGSFQTHFIGILGGVLAGVCTSREACFTKKISDNYSPWFLSLFVFGIALLVNSGMLLNVGEQHPVNMEILFIVIGFSISMVSGFYLTIIGYNKISSNMGGIIGTSEMLFGIIFGYLIFSEGLKSLELVGALFIFGGILIQIIKGSENDVKKQKIIIRDFDGPIIDSKESAFAFYKNNYSGFTDETVKRLFDGNFFQEFKNITGKDFSIDATLTKSDYETFLLTMNAVEGIQDVIHGFQEKGYKQYIVTSNIANLTEFLSDAGIYNCFAKILDGNIERSKIKKFHMVHEKEGGAISDYFFITDTVGDIKEAIEAGISRNHIYAVTWGYHDRERLEQIEGIRLVDKVEELVAI